MKKHLLILSVFLTAAFAKSQITFCPPGAVWHYDFEDYAATNIYLISHAITYTRDTVMNGETLKVLKFDQFFKGSCSNNGIYSTYIKQHGDTVFMNNGYTPGWQILYNFATPAGGYWITTIVNNLYPNNTSSNGAGTYTITVNSIDTVVINGVSLKRLHTSVGNITERFGADYLFYFQSGNCDGNNFYDFLCYQDNAFGNYQATDKACDYTNYDTGIPLQQQNASVSIYPNPADEMITVETGHALGACEIKVVDILGNQVLDTKPQFINAKAGINTAGLTKGIYFLKVMDNGKQIAGEKIIKN
jgi:hypothetical protein